MRERKRNEREGMRGGVKGMAVGGECGNDEIEGK